MNRFVGLYCLMSESSFFNGDFLRLSDFSRSDLEYFQFGEFFGKEILYGK